MRIDVFLAEKGLVNSRTEAKQLLKAGAVVVDGKPITKPSFNVEGYEEKVIVDRSSIKYVSRGGLKLDGALCAFEATPKEKLCIDVGASSGGFTDCLLQHGAKHVIAVDSGSGQLVKSIRQDKRVTVYENYNARYMKRSHFPYKPNFAVMDVSFISSTLIFESLYNILDDNADFICLVKPQFEVGRGALGKGGIVRDEKARNKALSDVVAYAKNIGFEAKAAMVSPITGGDGNIEFLVHFRKG
jgi:23S rRNA (cytidine1920-2'-O)/16S rRNA (cytidine1409-2'-O)-methyltransferase